jgi:hypothetical protein
MHMHETTKFVNSSPSAAYIARLVRFLAGLLSPSTFRSSGLSGLAPKTGPEGTLPNITFLLPRFAGLVRPRAVAAAFSAGLEGALSLVWKSSLVAGLLVGSTLLVDFFLGGDAMRDVPSWLDVGRDTGAGAGSLLVTFFRGTALGLDAVAIASIDGAVVTSVGCREGTSKAFPGVANFGRLDCFGFSPLGVGIAGSLGRTAAATALPLFEAVLGALSFLILGLLGVSAAGIGAGNASSLSFSSTKTVAGPWSFGAVLKSPNSKSCTSGSVGAS